jgi:hypothetical protein
MFLLHQDAAKPDQSDTYMRGKAVVARERKKSFGLLAHAMVITQEMTSSQKKRIDERDAREEVDRAAQQARHPRFLAQRLVGVTEHPEHV